VGSEGFSRFPRPQSFVGLDSFVPESIVPTVAAGKIGDFPIKSDVKLGPQTNLGADSYSEGTIKIVPKSWKWVIIISRRRGGT